MIAKLVELIRAKTSPTDTPHQRCPICVPTTPRTTTWRWCPTCEESWRDPTSEEPEAQEGTA
ncbi:hypothetical protein [Bounagaea algeriensis]